VSVDAHRDKPDALAVVVEIDRHERNQTAQVVVAPIDAGFAQLDNDDQQGEHGDDRADRCPDDWVHRRRITLNFAEPSSGVMALMVPPAIRAISWIGTMPANLSYAMTYGLSRA